jgi:hypothetical protein
LQNLSQINNIANKILQKAIKHIKRNEGFRIQGEREKEMKINKLRNKIHSIKLRKLAKLTALCISALFIISILSVFSLPAVRASTPIFSDSFASQNFSAWTGVSNNNGGTESVQTSTVYGGSNVAKFTLPSTANSWAVITKNLATTYSTLYLAGYICLDALPSSGNYLMAGITLDSIHGYDLASAYIHNNAGTYRWSLEYSGSGGKGYYVDSSSGLTVSVGTWYYIEVMCKVGSGTGETTMWANNTQISDVTGLTNNYDGASQTIQVGPYSPSALALNDYIENIVASTSFITMPTSTPTPTSTPVPTVSPASTPAPTATPTPTPTPSATNLTPIPAGWEGSSGCWRGIGNQAGDSLCTSTTYNGQPTLEINVRQAPVVNLVYNGVPTKILDPEFDGLYQKVSPGAHIVFSAYIKTTSSTIGDTCPYHGAFIDIDFYGANGRICGTQTPNGSEIINGVYPSNWDANIVPFGTSGWTYVSMNFIVPNQAYADGFGGPYPAGTLVTPTGFVPVIYVQANYGEGALVWIADTTLTVS